MQELTTDAFVRLAGGSLVGPAARAAGLVADSREVSPGVAFAAIRGGHAYVMDAIDAGASFVIAERADVVPSGVSAVIVNDTVASLAPVAAELRAALDVPVVAITGSTGKTMTRDMIATVLGLRFNVHRTAKNLNTEIGVPLTIFACPDDVQALVIELGARHVGEIAELCAIVRPTIGIVTGIGTAHIEEFGTREMIARTKSELLAALTADGLAIVPSNDDYLDVLAASTSARVMTVGPGGAVRYRAERIDPEGRTHGTVSIGSERVAVDLPVAGRALMRNAAFALAVASANGIDLRDAASVLATAEVTSWRMQFAHIGERVVINDAYNANPTSIASALRAARELAQNDGHRPVWAVLGPMAELGVSTASEHVRTGRLAAALGFAGLIVVGDDAGDIARGYEETTPGALQVSSLAEAVDAISHHVPSNAVIVVKASRVTGLERLVPLMETSEARPN